MTSSILATKLFIPPTRPELVPRPRLIEKLNKGINQKLTLVSAPAGFGKTTLVSEWVDNLRLDAKNDTQGKTKVAWVSLDEGDNDPVRFLTYLITALNRVDGNEDSLGKGALGMLQSPQPPPIEVVLTSLINEVAVTHDNIILVLDDYHILESLSVDDALTYLLEHLPPQMHLVIVTRSDPQLSVNRLRAQGLLTEVRAADLRFTSSEAADFLNQIMGLDLSVEDITALETRTEGWIAGLQLAALSLQGSEDTSSLIKSFSGSHRLVLDYLIEEVLDQQSESVQTFLLQTAILNRFTGSLCDALTGQDNGQVTLEMLENANLFIVPLDNDRYWYRYHHLFADLLLQRLRQTLPEQKQLLHRKASKWNENNGFINEAIEHALIAMDFERAAYLIEDQFGVNYERGNQTKLRSWLSEFPEDFVNSKPHLEILHAWILFTTGQLDEAEQILLIAEKILFHKTDQEPTSPPDEYHLNETNRMKLVGRIATIRSLLASYTGDLPRAIQYARQALEDLPETELPWRTAVLITLGDAYANMGQIEAAQRLHVDALEAARRSGDAYALMVVSLRQAEILRQQGELQQVRDICERQMHRANESGLSGLPIVGWLSGICGEVLAELNYPDQALDQAEKGVKLTARSRDVAMIGMSSLSLVRVLFSNGELHRAEEVIQSVENTARDSDIPLWALFPLSAWRVRIWLTQGKQGTATQWAEDHEMDPDGEPTYLHEMEYMVFVRILINQGRLDEAFRLIKTLLNASETGGRKSRMIEILILQALAFQVQCDMDEAMIPLEKALTLAEPEGFIRTFVDEGPPIARLLYEALKRGISPEYVSQLLASFPVDELEKPDPSKPQTPKTKLIEPLSDREIEVLQLISEGLTNSEIGSRLYLSPNTVKSHARNIFAKIEVNNRTQAGAKARALGLLKDT